MRRFHRAAHGVEDRQRPLGFEPAFALQHVAQVLAAHQLHHEVGAAVRQRAVVEDRHDGRMLQAGDDLRLAPETLARVGVAEQFSAHHFQRDEPVEPYVARAVHGPHSAARDELFDAVLVVHYARHRGRHLHQRAVGRTSHGARLLAAAARRAFHHRLRAEQRDAGTGAVEQAARVDPPA